MHGMTPIARDAPGFVTCGRSGLPLLAVCSSGHRRTIPFRLLKTSETDRTPIYGRPFKCRACGRREGSCFRSTARPSSRPSRTRWRARRSPPRRQRRTRGRHSGSPDPAKRSSEFASQSQARARGPPSCSVQPATWRARREALEGDLATVWHRANGRQWVVTWSAGDFLSLVPRRRRGASRPTGVAASVKKLAREVNVDAPQMRQIGGRLDRRVRPRCR